MSDSVSATYWQWSDLDHLRQYRFRPTHRIEGQYVGRHRSFGRGMGTDFVDYRPFMPGDDRRSIDWAVYGRTDRLVVRQTEQAAQLSMHLMIDGSASMAYTGNGSMSKWDYACRLAGLIGAMTLQQQDRLSLGIAQEGLSHFYRSIRTMTTWHETLNQMVTTVPSGRADLHETLMTYRRQISKHGLFVLLSDLHETPSAPLDALLGNLVASGMTVLVLRVVHPDELRLPDQSRAELIDSETGDRVKVDLESLRSTYRQTILAGIQRRSERLTHQGVICQTVTMDVAPIVSLSRYLVSRGSDGF